MDAHPSRLVVRPLTTDDAVDIANWHYADRWASYDLGSAAVIVDEIDSYRAVFDAADTLAGFVCVDDAARVPGLEPDPAFVDVGVGLHPALVGRGVASAFGDAALDHVSRRHPGRRLRAVIQDWNIRSTRFAEGRGFVTVGAMVSEVGGQQVRYRILVKPNTTRDVVAARSGIFLFSARLVLREFDASDEAAVHSYASDPTVTRFMDWGPNTSADTSAFMARTLAERSTADRTEFTLAAVRCASNDVVGSGALRITDARRRLGDLGYVIHPDFWSRGYATEVASALIRFGFGHLGLRQISATCNPANHASARVLQKAGLGYQGTSGESLHYAIVEGAPS